MEINRTGPRSPQFEDPAQAEKRTAARFKSPAPSPADPGSTVTPANIPPGITQADLRDQRKAEALLKQCFGNLVDQAGQQLGVPISDTQKQNLLEFLGNDPVMRGKLLNYLEQNVK
jgi:hypothetical protein